MTCELEDQLGRAAEQVSRHCRLGGAVEHLDALATQTALCEDDYRLYFMAWRVTRLLAPGPADLVSPRESSPPPAVPA